ADAGGRTAIGSASAERLDNHLAVRALAAAHAGAASAGPRILRLRLEGADRDRRLHEEVGPAILRPAPLGALAAQGPLLAVAHERDARRGDPARNQLVPGGA